ncbi:MAG TPA: hypothetical protein VGB14_10760 [Acidimicrobiales bacterium]|jgi:Fe-S cluster biogenesis protein NfuA
MTSPTFRADRRPTRPRLEGTAVTVLAPTLAEVPWRQHYALGNGIDAVTGAMYTSRGVKPFTPVDRNVANETFEFRLVEDDSEFSRQVHASVSGSYNLDGVDLSASSEYLTEVTYTQRMMSLVARFQKLYDGYDLPAAWELTDEARRLMDSDPAKFREAYGDYFVAGHRRGSSFVAVYTCTAHSATSMDKFKASFGGQAPQVFKADGSVAFQQAAKSNGIDISVKVVFAGARGSCPVTPTTPEQVIQALDWFKANEVGEPLRAQLNHYSSLHPTYSRSVAIDPNVFDDLHALYTTYFRVVSKFTACPPTYQGSLQDRYDDFTRRVASHQAQLPDDAGLRTTLRDAGASLLGDLDKVFARWELWSTVQNLSETNQNDEHTDDGQTRAWRYGLTSWSGVDVASHAWEYADSGQFGWREHGFDWSNDGELVVGWEMYSNWGDGTNGFWKKTSDHRILLSSSAAAYVKSQWGRGCNWRFTVWTVPKALFRF